MSKMINGKMYKILVPMKGKDGETSHWMRLGTGFTNKDGSINCYVEAVPLHVFAGKEFVIQIREFSEDDLRKRDDFRPRSGNGNGTSSFSIDPPRPETVPF